MLQRLPANVGHVLRNLRPGLDKIVANDPMVASPRTFPVHSRAFVD